MNLSGIGPGGKGGDDVELAKEAADDLVGIALGAEAIELRHHLRQRFLDVRHGAGGVVLALLLEAPFTFDEFFAVEIGNRMENRIALRARIGQEARQTVPRRSHISKVSSSLSGPSGDCQTRPVSSI